MEEGEDLSLVRLFYSFVSQQDSDYRETFLDIGAFDPILASNTYLLYRRAWRGLNIEVNPDSMARFHLHRPEDLTINAGVGSRKTRWSIGAFRTPS